MSLHNPFLWKQNPRPSIFLADGDSATRSRRASQAVDRKTAQTGVNPGTLHGLGRKTHRRDTETAWSRSNSGVG